MGPTKITPEDQQFNINFVGEVKKHPCLFDSNSVEYKQTAVQDKAWHAVSSAVDESVDTCKKRWRNLRCCMTRYLKSVRDNSDLQPNLRRKPYYLYAHMQFVLPFLKAREDGANYEQDESAWIKQNSSATEEMMKPDDDECDDEPQEMETMDIQEEDHDQQQLKDSIIQSIKILPINPDAQSHEHHEQHEALSVSEAGETTTTYEIITATPTKQARLTNSHHSVETANSSGGSPLQTPDSKKDMLGQRQFFAITGNSAHTMPCFATQPNVLGHQPQMPTFAQQTQLQTQPAQHFALIPSASTIVSDADHNFFQSIVPDIQPMTLEQKRKLKIGILQLIDTILKS
uniref:MADF domain-containing protein n=1 Tax=Anopheles atroparvus TaxID=41427 RepID=A0A182J6P4_ANOAO